jgi:hypothetical protein
MGLLVHAIIDACWAPPTWATSAAFPDTDARFRAAVLWCAKYDRHCELTCIGNIDSTVIARRAQTRAAYRPWAVLADALGMDVSRVSSESKPPKTRPGGARAEHGGLRAVALLFNSFLPRWTGLALDLNNWRQ